MKKRKKIPDKGEWTRKINLPIDNPEPCSDYQMMSSLKTSDDSTSIARGIAIKSDTYSPQKPTISNQRNGSNLRLGIATSRKLVPSNHNYKSSNPKLSTRKLLMCLKTNPKAKSKFKKELRSKNSQENSKYKFYSKVVKWLPKLWVYIGQNKPNSTWGRIYINWLIILSPNIPSFNVWSTYSYLE